MERNLTQLNLATVLTKLTTLRILRRKSTWFLLAVGMFPMSVAVLWLWSSLSPNSAPPLRPFAMFNHIQSLYFHVFYIPLLAIFLGLGTINDEIETKNLTFTLVRPLTRLSIAVGRFLGHLGAALALLNISLVGSYFANMLFQFENLFDKLPLLLNAMFITSCGLAAYLGVVAALGTWFKKFAIMGSIVWMVFDTGFSLLPVDALKMLSIKSKILAGYWETLPQHLFTAVTIIHSPASLNGFILLLIAAVSCALITFRLSSNEIIMSDSSE